MNHSPPADSRFHAQPKCQQRPALLTSADRTSSSQSKPHANTSGARLLRFDFLSAVSRPKRIFADHGNGSTKLDLLVKSLLADWLRFDVDKKTSESPPPSTDVSQSAA
ncbi:hypothetical protein P9239_19325 [Caballeronia sp. LZ062]|uniref:hypothetical protein n=1 Tax=unclassified Caballeronia TaxID=2646786 RepID=UPI0028571D77|nr:MULTISPECIES: hypothetical protein [unclassified Caballeronia]MDR5855708.1 hypothetical protein [Caballeronia sp. LZ050]MDR5872504.1 hypothetical protein [Caballeronia sp. LZ062]